jgi:hypothetical protein
MWWRMQLAEWHINRASRRTQTLAKKSKRHSGSRGLSIWVQAYRPIYVLVAPTSIECAARSSEQYHDVIVFGPITS